MSVINRYSDSDLEEFKAVIEKKLATSTEQYESLMGQIRELAESSAGESTKDLTDFSSSHNEMDMLNTMASRQRSYIQDLNAALIRIRNKTYGICAVSGNLIDKKRLMAVPTTTKSLQAKAEIDPATTKKAARIDGRAGKPVKKKKPTIISKVVKKASNDPVKKRDDLSRLLDDDDDDDDNNDSGIEEIDLSGDNIDLDD